MLELTPSSFGAGGQRIRRHVGVSRPYIGREYPYTLSGTEKFKPGDKYDPRRFVVKCEEWVEAVRKYENRYRKQLAEEKQQK